MAKPNKTNITEVKKGTNRKIETSRTSGSQATKGQTFYANTHLNHKASKSDVFEFAAPQYSGATTGTLDFNGQSFNSIFEIYGRGQLSFSFSANNETFISEGYNFMSHDIYKIPNRDLERYRNNTTQENYESIKNKIERPFISFSASTAVTSTLLTSSDLYTFSPEQFDKPIRGLSEQIFEDKSMYFFNIKHSFSATLNNYKDVIGMDERRVRYNRELDFETQGDVNKIETGPFSGLSAQGMFFTCFTPPNRPQLENPKPESYSCETFSPEFFFSNVTDGDEYVVEITYEDVNSGFTVFSATSRYFFSTDDACDPNGGNRPAASIEKTSFISESTRRVSVPIVPGSVYYYRVGNVKYVVNLFGVKQSIITYTDPFKTESFSGQSVEYTVDSSISRKPVETSKGGSKDDELNFPPYVPQR